MQPILRPIDFCPWHDDNHPGCSVTERAGIMKGGSSTLSAFLGYDLCSWVRTRLLNFFVPVSRVGEVGLAIRGLACVRGNSNSQQLCVSVTVCVTVCVTLSVTVCVRARPHASIFPRLSRTRSAYEPAASHPTYLPALICWK